MKEPLPLRTVTVNSSDNPMNVGIPVERVKSFPWQGTTNNDGLAE
jgi:hypothetical protein